jgi:hypothetical protein
VRYSSRLGVCPCLDDRLRTPCSQYRCGSLINKLDLSIKYLIRYNQLLCLNPLSIYYYNLSKQLSTVIMGIFKIFRGKRDRKQSPVLSSDVKEQGSSDGPQKKVDPIVSIPRNLPPDPPGSFPKVVKSNSFRKVQTIQTIQSSTLVSLCDT